MVTAGDGIHITLFSPSANVLSDRVEARVRIMTLMGATQLRSNSWMSGSLKRWTHQRALECVRCLIPANAKPKPLFVTFLDCLIMLGLRSG